MNVIAILPKEMGSNNPIMRSGFLTNQGQVYCGSIAGKYTMGSTVVLKVSKDLLL